MTFFFFFLRNIVGTKTKLLVFPEAGPAFPFLEGHLQNPEASICWPWYSPQPCPLKVWGYQASRMWLILVTSACCFPKKIFSFLMYASFLSLPATGCSPLLPNSRSSLTRTLSFCICLTLSHRSEPSVSSLDYSSATLVVKDLVLHLQALLAAVEGGHAPGLSVSINVLSKSRQRPGLLWCRLPSSGFCSQILCDRDVQPEVDYDGEEQDVEGHHPQQMLYGMSILLKI